MAATKREDRIASVIVALFSVAYLMGAFMIKKPVYKQQLGPEAFPKAVGFLMTALSIVYIVQSFMGKGKEDEARAAVIGAEEKVEQKANLKKMVTVIVIMLAYAALFIPLGYALSTFLAMLASVLVLDRRKIVRDVIISVIASAGMYVVFNYLLRVELPVGVLSLLGL